MKKFEYTDIRLKGSDLEGSRERMNELGKEGWQLISVIQDNQITDSNGNFNRRAYFSREVQVPNVSTFGVIE